MIRGRGRSTRQTSNRKFTDSHNGCRLSLTDKEAVRDKPLLVKDGFVFYITMEKINIYIKGVCDYRNGRRGAYALAVARITEIGVMDGVYYSSKSYATVKNNFVAEIEGITDALKHINVNAEIDVFTNNQALVSILSEEHYGYKYDDVIRCYWDEAKYKKITINWIRKADNDEWMDYADKRANKLMNS